MVFLSGSESVQVFVSFFYICNAVGDSVIKRGGLVPLEIQLSRGEVWCRWRFSYQEGGFGTPLTGSTPPHFCASPKPGPGFPMSYVMVFFVFNEFS